MMEILKMVLKRLFFLILACAILISCSPNNVTVIDDSPADGKLLSFPLGFYQNVVYIEGRLLGFTFGNAREPANRVLYAYEGDSDLELFDPLDAKDCPMFIGYAMKGLLPDGRIGFLGCGQGSNWTIFALDWKTGEVKRLVRALAGGYSSKDFTWNPEMTRGVQEMVDAAQGTIYWIAPDGIAPMDVEIEDQGFIWNLKDYYEHRDNFEPGIGYALSPAWSPDGETIAFFASTYGMREVPRLKGNIKFELYFMEPSELKPVQILNGIANAARIRWSEDSKHLLFQGCVGAKRKCGLWIYSLEAKTLTLVTEGEFFEDYIWKNLSTIVVIKFNIDEYLDESEIWEYSIGHLLKP
jgi:hypothetical protein